MEIFAKQIKRRKKKMDTIGRIGVSDKKGKNVIWSSLTSFMNESQVYDPPPSPKDTHTQRQKKVPLYILTPKMFLDYKILNPRK